MNIAVKMVIQLWPEKFGRDTRPLGHEVLASHQFTHKDEGVHEDNQDNNGDAGGAPGRIA
jgi:hypothetical protein